MNVDLDTRVFKYVDNNMKRDGGSFLTSEKAYSYYLKGTNAKTVDVHELMNLDPGFDNYDYIRLLFLCAFNRTISLNEETVWRKHYAKPQDKFRRLALSEIICSPEFRIVGKKFINNKGVFSRYSMRRFAGMILSFIYNNIFMKLPGNLRDYIRKVLVH